MSNMPGVVSCQVPSFHVGHPFNKANVLTGQHPSWDTGGKFKCKCNATQHAFSQDPNDCFFSSPSSRLSTKHNVGTGGIKWNATQHDAQQATSQKSAGLISTCDRNHLSDQFVSKRRESPSWLQSNHNHGQHCPSVMTD